MVCLHEAIDLDYLPMAFSDTNVLMISFSVRCRQCGPLRCLGIDYGISTRRPATSADGCTFYIPFIPEFEKEEARKLAS